MKYSFDKIALSIARYNDASHVGAERSKTIAFA